MAYYLALGTALSGTMLTEVADSGYTRQALSLVANGPGLLTNAGGLTFGPAASGFGTTAVHAVFDALTGGNMLMAWTRTGAPAVPAGSTDTTAARALSLTFPDLAKANGNSSVTWPKGTVIGTTQSGRPIVSGVDLQFAAGLLSATTASGALPTAGGQVVGSLIVGSPSGGDPGPGAINAEAVQVNGAAVLTVSPADQDVDTIFTAAGAIDPTLNYVAFNNASAMTMTLANGVDAHVLAMANIGAGTVTVSITVNGISGNPTIATGHVLRVKWSPSNAGWFLASSP